MHARENGTDLPGGLGDDYVDPADAYRPLGGHAVPTGLATHELSRLLTKDKVTSFLRALFTECHESSGHGELEERGRGLRLATGELLVCPYCVAQWVAGGFVVGHVFAPRLTRLPTTMWSAHAVADAAQLAYSAAEQRT